MTNYSLKNLRPIAVDDLVRVGANGDGGYVLSQSQIDKTNTLLSFGVCDNWTFEADFLHRRQAMLYAYDFSVSRKFFVKRCVFELLSGRIAEAFAVIGRWINFGQFFNPKQGKRFFKKYVGIADDEQNVSVASIFTRHLTEQPEELGVFVKMDIEDSEYCVLPDFKPYYRFINGFAIEFHWLDICSSIFEEMIADLSADFYLAHIHGNNWSGCIPRTALPIVLEITFINKRLVPSQPTPSERAYPVAGLDFPNNNGRPDLPLLFE